MKPTIFRNINIVNEGSVYTADVLVKNSLIDKIENVIGSPSFDYKEVKGDGLYLFPGMIDDQVHFREPGLTHKANIFSESRAAVAGGVTSFMEMPNTVPNAVTIDLLEEKYAIASRSSLANYSFFMGGTNDNLEELKKKKGVRLL